MTAVDFIEESDSRVITVVDVIETVVNEIIEGFAYFCWCDYCC